MTGWDEQESVWADLCADKRKVKFPSAWLVQFPPLMHGLELHGFIPEYRYKEFLKCFQHSISKRETEIENFST